MYKLIFYVPEDSAESVKKAVFDAGAGNIGNYDQCCWQVLGQGQFRPLVGSSPHLGQHNTLETVMEYRIELVCDENKVNQAVAALKHAHPYEEPAYDVVKLKTL